MAEVTTIKIDRKTKRTLDAFREHPRESYAQVIRKIAFVAENLRDEPELSRETLRRLDESRAMIARGEFVTLEELSARMGIALPPRRRPSDRKIIQRSAQRIKRARAAQTLSGRRVSEAFLQSSRGH